MLITDREFSKSDEGGAGARQGEAAGDRLRRSGIFRRAASGSARSNTRSSSREGDPDFAWTMPDDEWDAISLNYTSGTTGDPKGVVYHHRGAHLLAIGNVVTCGMGKHPVYLWTLPMFHCNGWCFPWSISVGRRHACVPARGARARRCTTRSPNHKVTHLCGAPIVMATLLNAPDEREEAAAACGGVLHRGRAAARGRARRDEGGGLQRHAPLWPDRMLRPGGGERLACRMGRAAARRAGGEEGAPGRALRRARSARRDATPRRWRRCRATARRSAK